MYFYKHYYNTENTLRSHYHIISKYALTSQLATFLWCYLVVFYDTQLNLITTMLHEEGMNS